MKAEVIPISSKLSEQKATLIGEALNTLRMANAIDERDELDASSLLVWYDATIPEVKDIKILAGAMEIELAKRRGERLAQDGERRGGDQSKVSQRETLISGAEKHQRERDRALAAQPDAVDAYVKREATSGRVPSRRGAVRAAKAARGKSKKESPKDPSYQWNREPIIRPVYTAIDKVRDQPLTLAAMAKLLGMVYPPSPGGGRSERGLLKFLREVALTPWASVSESDNRYTVMVDEELRAICDGRMARPAGIEALEGKSVWDWIRSLDAEIDRRRAENNDKFGRHRWAPSEIKKADQTDQLNWLQRQFKKVASLQ